MEEVELKLNELMEEIAVEYEGHFYPKHYVAEIKWMVSCLKIENKLVAIAHTHNVLNRTHDLGGASEFIQKLLLIEDIEMAINCNKSVDVECGKLHALNEDYYGLLTRCLVKLA